MAVNRTDHATILVRDLGEALAWYEGVLGLELLYRNGPAAALACRGAAADLTLLAGGQGLESVAFGVDHRDDLDRMAHSLNKHAVPHKRRPGDRLGVEEALRFVLPSGHAMEFVVASAGRVAGKTEFRSDGTFRPSDIDHVNLLGEIDPEQLSRFMREVLGFKQSLALTIGDAWVGSWMRSTGFDHDIAYMRAVRPADRLHHVAFAMEDGNHYFRLGDRLIETGHRWEYGPGRHMGGVPRSTTSFGTNTFAYAFDPTGNRNEFSGGMNEYADGESLLAETRPELLGDVMNGWARNMPETFMTTGS